ncbi:unnamed protein product [Prorocentrum cordatum]|uniref:Uncharacterized protein n=1 Tax=Prorocentrum cordatum TaxID=2364126 RepID=A0ABN9UKR6_9DINO|nr:unnamed protein product [Polarella glacialis]
MAGVAAMEFPVPQGHNFSSRQKVTQWLAEQLSVEELGTARSSSVAYLELVSLQHETSIANKLNGTPLSPADFAVQRTSDASLKREREDSAKDVKKGTGIAEKLLDLYGSGGNARAKRRFAQSLARTVDRSSSVAASGLRTKAIKEEAPVDAESDE